MSPVSPEPRAALIPIARTTLNARVRCTDAKNFGTHQYRQKNYITKFVADHKLTTNPLLINVLQEDRNLIMACYATFLMMGHTLLCKSIKVGTIKKYLLAAKDYFLDNNQWDPCITKQGKTASVLLSVYKEGNRWESMPNRQEPLTIDMTQHLISQAQACHQDSSEAAIADWCIIGL